MEILAKNILNVGEDSKKDCCNISIYENPDKPLIINKNIFQINNNNWWKPSINGKKRIMICGTYPIGTSNGYSKVVYYISKYLGKYDDIELTIYGFQNFSNTVGGASLRSDISPNVKIYDAYANENPKRNGFGELEIGDFIHKNPQDIIIIFNDNVITTSITANIMKSCGDARNNFKLISYMDQVYPYQKKDYLEILNTYFDGIIAFTPYWAEIARKLGIKEHIPIYVLPHGFDHIINFPIPKNICRTYYDYNQEAFMVLNMNRNQPRKNWDITIIAWIEFVERHYQINIKNKKIPDVKINKHTKRPIKLIVATAIDGFWDLMDVIENEVKFRDLPLEYAKNTIQPVSMPQQLSDRDVNILYNACDVSLNTCSGEGFGLCQSDSLGLGKPQIASHIGGMLDFINEQNSIPIKPCMSIYLDNKSQGIGGKAELINPHDVAEAFWKYFSNPELVEKHGKKGRELMLTHYKWENLIDYFHNKIIKKL